MHNVELIVIGVVFCVPILAAAIAGALMQRRSHESPLRTAVTVGNVVVLSLAPLACSLILLQRSLLPSPVAVVTMVGFVPAATSFCFWYVLSHRNNRKAIRINALSFTLFNIVLPTVLALLQKDDPAWSLLGVCAFDFLSLVLAASIVLIGGPVRASLRPPREWAMILGGTAFALFVFLMPALTFEYRWLSTALADRGGILNPGLWLELLPRYLGAAAYISFLVRHLRAAVGR